MATSEAQMISSQRAHTQNKETNNTPFYDALCIGFGATGVALAVAFNDQNPNLKIQFVEQQSRRSWKPSAQSVGERMRTSFLDDLITARNPRSEFTFVNYLHTVGQLVTFTNLSDIKPSRYQYAQYLTWCASHFKDQVVYGKKVLRVEPVYHENGLVTHWKVVTRDVVSNKAQVLFAKRVISAVGKQPRIPVSLSSPGLSGQLLHASDCLEATEGLLEPTQKSRHIALVGDGQQAAEVFLKFHTELSPHKITWYTRESVLRPRSDTAFTINALQQPNVSQPSIDYPPELRRQYLLNQGSPDYAHGIDLDIVDKLYDLQYTLRVKQPDETSWSYQIRPYMEVEGAERTPEGQVKLSFRDLRNGSISTDETRFDLVIAATGYERSEYLRVLKNLEPLSEQGSLTVDRDYKLNLVKRAVSPGIGIWVLGSLQNSDDVSHYADNSNLPSSRKNAC
ncbi:putative l-ornithine 5-monooxygenase [Phaeomoniella chlamydospora]|uniref:L-ornithine N(5)-monooxygenase n=1 Tax=Phaeomoniella chlamydospora TaxID=158046 RepID=A0A0G2DVJ7_PHACM|nr:putative l-ornithine 5-monooxygenase [Phaeomoniella chlamydospora]